MNQNPSDTTLEDSTCIENRGPAAVPITYRNALLFKDRLWIGASLLLILWLIVDARDLFKNKVQEAYDNGFNSGMYYSCLSVSSEPIPKNLSEMVQKTRGLRDKDLAARLNETEVNAASRFFQKK